MSDVFISYALSTADQAQPAARALRCLGYSVWLDDELPAHRAYTDVIEERLKSAKAVVVIWSADAVKSHWVRAEANAALEAGTLVQLSLDGVPPPMPFNQIQCAEMAGWTGDLEAPGWRKVVTSIADLVGAPGLLAAVAESVPPPLPNKPSIMVMPFANLSGDPEQDYFADGMVEEITRALSRFKSLFVIGAGSGLSFKGKATTPQEAARTLGVRYVLEGSVRKASDRVRIAVKLIDGADGAQIWADRFEDTLDDVFALQDKVALGVANVIGTAVREADLRRASGRPTENMNSYDLFLSAQSFQRTLGKANLLAALDLYKRAIALDPDYGLAMASAANCLGSIVINGWSDDAKGDSSEARILIQRALKVTANDAEVLGLLAAATLAIEGDIETAIALSDRAMVLNPGSAIVWAMSGNVRLHLGEPQLAFEHFETALRLDPFAPFAHYRLGMQGAARLAQRRFTEAVALLRRAAQLAPDAPSHHAMLAASYGHLGNLSAAREALARFRSATTMEIRDFGARRGPALVQELFVDGIDLAEGKTPSSVAAGADKP